LPAREEAQPKPELTSNDAVRSRLFEAKRRAQERKAG
jgi:hypothetical protein